jgi:serine/threonine protein kinase/Flp pilus assembly protein TadD
MTAEHWQRVEQLCNAALECEASQRGAFLAQACGGDDELRREVESLLSQEKSAEGFLEAPAIGPVAKMFSEEQGESLIGRQVGSYQILCLLGAGGMGEVYQAHDTKLRRDVAIKVLPAAFVNDPERLSRFQREARMLASLNHPNIATIYGLEQSNGTNYLVMELVPGQTLAERVGAGPVLIKEALPIASQIAEALEAAHERGVIHRDLKPANVKVTPEGKVKVLDFGLAKAFASDGALDPSQSPTVTGMVSEEGRILGTPAYMSPEQARGKAVDKRTDIWSFGCVLYELLTGRKAFRGETLTDTLAGILEREPDWQSLPATTPAGIRDLLRRCLEKDSQRRLRDLGDARIQIEKALTPTHHSEYKLVRLAWAGVATLIALGSALVALNVGGIRDRFPTRSSSQSDSIAVLPFENLSHDPEQEYFVDGMTDELITDLASINTLRVISRTSVMQYKKIKKPLREIAQELRVNHIVEGSVLRDGGRVRITAQLIDVSTDRHLWAKSYERDLRDILALQGEVAQSVASEIQVKLTPADRARLEDKRPVNPDIYETYLKGRYYANRVGEEGTKKAVEYFEQAIQEDSNFARAYSSLAANYAILGNLGALPAKDEMPKAKSAALKALAIDQRLAEAHTALGVVKAFYDYDWPEAERELKRAVELNPGEAEVHHWYAHYLTIQGQLDNALAEFQRARDLDPLSPTLNQDVANTLYLMRRYDEAIQQSRKAVELDPNYYWPSSTFGMVYEQTGKYEEAIAAFRKAYSLAPSPRNQAALGQGLAVAGRKDEARKVLNEMNNLSRKRYISPFEIATVYIGLGEKDQAFEWLEKAYEARNFGLILLKVDPWFDNLRSDPRFQDLLRRMNL